MTQKIIVYIIIAVSVIYLLRWIYRFYRSAGRKARSIPEKCKSCPEFRVSCSDPSRSNCPEMDNGNDSDSCCP